MLELRAALATDIEILLAIQREAAVDAFAHVYPPEGYPFPDDAISEVWREALEDPEVEVYVAELDGEAVGAVSVGKGFLSTLYVLPAYQGSGSARRCTISRSSGCVLSASGRRGCGRCARTTPVACFTSGAAGS